MSDISNLVKDVVASPLGAVISSVGQGVADAQEALDNASLAKTLEMYSEGGEEAAKLLREMGYTPTFYTLPETTGEVKVALRLGNTQQTAQTHNTASSVAVALSRLGQNVPGVQPKMYATPVDAGYANRYGYQADISAKLTFKIVPVPPPNGVDELRVLPDLTGATPEDARQRLADLDLGVLFIDAEGNPLEEPEDTATVSAQIPSASGPRATIVRAETEVTLTVSGT